jgi:hypothetical protein
MALPVARNDRKRLAGRNKISIRLDGSRLDDSMSADPNRDAARTYDLNLAGSMLAWANWGGCS